MISHKLRMALGNWIILWLLVWCIKVCAADDCTSYMDESHHLHINCSNRGLTDVPNNLSQNVIYLNLSFNEIQILYTDDFRNLRKLEYLDLCMNPIHTLEPSTFEGLESLLVLEMTSHHLNYSEQSVPYDVFTPLTSLTNLTLKRDFVTNVKSLKYIQTDRALWPLSNLIYLIIDTVPNMIFSNSVTNLTSLKYLIVGGIERNDLFIHTCELYNIRNETFSAFANVSVEYLDISGGIFNEFETGSLKPFPNLKSFKMNTGRLTKYNISQILLSLKVYINQNMSLIQIIHVYPIMFRVGLSQKIDMEILSKICIEEIDLSDNFLETVNFDIFLSQYPFPLLAKCIKRFHLNKNKITGKATRLFYSFLPELSNLEYLDVSLQSIYRPTANLVNFKKNLSQSHIPMPLILPPKLQYLNFGGGISDIGRFRSFYIFNANNLRYFNLSRCNLQQSTVNTTVFGLENLKVLDISKNNIELQNPHIFNNFPNLTELYMVSIGLNNDFLNLPGGTLFKPLQRLEILDISLNNLFFISNNVFTPLINLKRLNLAFNNLVTIPDFSSFHKLNYLILNFNSITDIKLSTRTMLDKTYQVNKNFHLRIGGNTLYCNCEALDFILWLNETQVKLDGRNYSCIDIHSKSTTTALLFHQFKYYHRTCYSSIWLSIATGGFGFLFFSLLAAFLVIKNKMKLKILIQRLLGRFVNPLKREDFKYDVFIIYSDSIYRLVCHQMRDELETNRQFKLNIRHREQLFGDFQADYILDSIRNSWKIIFILNQDMIESEMAFFSMYHCLTAMKMTTPNKVVLLVDRHLDIPASLAFFLEGISEENIIIFDFEQEVTDLFWNKLYRILLQQEPLE